MMTTISFRAKSFTISGEYLTVSNGFTTTAYGEVQLQYADILSAEVITRRPKRLFYALLFSAGVLVLIEGVAGVFSYALVILLGLLVCGMAAAYVFAASQFAEITTMQGTYRIPIPPGDAELHRGIDEIRHRII
jgi:hypothetical protein